MKNKKYMTLSEINVTSLVDVSLVLLIIFMITTPLLKSSVEVNLPKTSVEETKAREGILVTLTHNGQIYLDQDKVTVETLEDKLMQRYIARSGQSILLKADKQVEYGQVINIMDKIKSIGISKVGLIVETGKK